MPFFNSAPLQRSTDGWDDVELFRRCMPSMCSCCCPGKLHECRKSCTGKFSGKRLQTDCRRLSPPDRLSCVAADKVLPTNAELGLGELFVCKLAHVRGGTS